MCPEAGECSVVGRGEWGDLGQGRLGTEAISPKLLAHFMKFLYDCVQLSKLYHQETFWVIKLKVLEKETKIHFLGLKLENLTFTF